MNFIHTKSFSAHFFSSFSCLKQKKQEALEAERILREKEEQEAKEKVNVLQK
jgi:hypothetical protein